MCSPAALLDLPSDQLLNLHHDATLELLRRYPPRWPHLAIYNIARRLFDITRELHQAIASAPTNGQPTGPDHQPVGVTKSP